MDPFTLDYEKERMPKRGGRSSAAVVRIKTGHHSQFHSNFKIVRRSLGQSSVASAAYRSGERLVDERTGEVYDYSGKEGVEYSEIVAPDGAPEWAKDREKVWNEMEKAERRGNAQPAIKNTIALPHNLSLEERIKIVREYAQKLSEAHGVVVDFSLHAPHAEKSDERNYHAHLAFTTRRIGKEGFTEKVREWQIKSEKEWDKKNRTGDKPFMKMETEYRDRFYGKTGKDIVKTWRVELAKSINRGLERNGFEKTFDHRSLKEQGFDREPTKHMGPTASEMEKRGARSERGDINRSIVSLNERRAEIRKELEQIQTEESAAMPGASVLKLRERREKENDMPGQTAQERLKARRAKSQDDSHAVGGKVLGAAEIAKELGKTVDGYNQGMAELEKAQTNTEKLQARKMRETLDLNFVEKMKGIKKHIGRLPDGELQKKMLTSVKQIEKTLGVTTREKGRDK